MTQLAAVIGQHAALPEDDEYRTSTGSTEVTHVQGIRAGG
jgi:hypothetical protein